MKTIESDIQKMCVRWFKYQYTEYEKVFFCVPNGGKRNVVTAQILKAEGVLAGVADLALMVPCGGYHGLFIEMKSDKGKQQQTQKEFQEAVERNGYKYIICRSLDNFINEVKKYLKDTGNET